MTIYEDRILKQIEGEKLEYLYLIEKKDWKSSESVLKRVPIIKETKQSYYVPRWSFVKSKKEFVEKYGENDTSRMYLVKKDTMRAKVSNCGVTHEQYYQHPFLAKESYFVNINAYAIGKALSASKNPFLLRQVAHNLEMENLKELQYDEDVIEEQKQKEIRK